MDEGDGILQLEMKINRLKIEYDQYFAGRLKIPPFKLHEDVKKIIKWFSNRTIHNTALAFKYKSLAGRYSSYNNLWSRYLRRLEEGTFKRGAGFAPMASISPSAGKGGPGTDSQVELLYREYIAAKRSLNQKTTGIKIESIADMVNKWTSQIREQYECARVEFKVVIDSGKAKIKATPKK